MKTANLIKFLSAYADYNVEIDNYNDYEPKYAVVDDTHKELRLTDDYRELWVALDEECPVWNIETGKKVQFGIYLHYEDGHLEYHCECYDTYAQADRRADRMNDKLPCEDYEAGIYYKVKEMN